MAARDPVADNRARIEQVAASETYGLRHRVLRPHQLVFTGFPGDEQPDAGNFAAFDESGEVIGCVSVTPEPPPPGVKSGLGSGSESGGSWRLRGMATNEAYRNQGIGSALLTAAVAHVAGHGGTLLWCNARIPAVPFYRRGGFAPTGEPWEEADIGPHIVMWRAIGPSP